MNLLLIVPKLTGGGAERVASRLANEFCKTDRVFLFCMYPREGLQYACDSRVTIAQYAKTPGLMGRRAADHDRISQLRRRKKEWQIDCSISFLRSCNYFNVKSRIGERVLVSARCICEYETFASAKERRYAGRQLRLAAMYSDAVIGVSRRVSKEQIRKYGAPAKHTATIYNPVDPEELRQQMAEPLPETVEAFRKSHDAVFVTAGRLDDQKGQRHAVRALVLIRRERNAGLIILGTGPLLEELQELTQKLGLSEHVLFAGFTDRTFAYYAIADAFVFPSLYEGFPNALLEALACGLPAVSCDCNSGPRELLSPGSDPETAASGIEEAPYGLLIPPFSLADDRAEKDQSPSEETVRKENLLAEAMLRLLEEPDLADRYREQGRKRADDFSPEIIAGQWRSVIDAASAPGGGIFRLFRNGLWFAYRDYQILIRKPLKKAFQKIYRFVRETCRKLRKWMRKSERAKRLQKKSEQGKLTRMSDERYLKKLYRLRMGERLNLKNPRTFNEKLNWLKLHDHNPDYIRFADKVEAKKAVAERIGAEHVIPLYGVYETFDEIPFDELPDQFVIKCSHDSGSCVVCRDKAAFDRDAAREKIERLRKRNYYLAKREWVYKNVRPRVLVEQYIEGLGTPDSVEYKVSCFGGRAEFYTVCRGIAHSTFDSRYNDFYDREGNHLPFYVYYRNSPDPVVIPKEMGEILRLSEILAKDIAHVRVDWYLIDGRIYFGEMTFYTWNGTCRFTPEEWNRKIGELIDLTPVKESGKNE